MGDLERALEQLADSNRQYVVFEWRGRLVAMTERAWEHNDRRGVRVKVRREQLAEAGAASISIAFDSFLIPATHMTWTDPRIFVHGELVVYSSDEIARTRFDWMLDAWRADRRRAV